MGDVEFYLLVSGLAFLLVAPFLLWSLQALGFPAAYRLGFRVGEYYRSGAPEVTATDPTGSFKIRKRRENLLLSERIWLQNEFQSYWTSGWPDKLMGVVEREGDQLKLTLRTNHITTYIWAGPTSMTGLQLIWGFATSQPGLQNEGGLFIAVIFGAIVLGVLWFRRRAQRRATEIAQYLGFSPA